MMLSLLALAVAPGIAIILYVYSKDKYDREPLKNLVICFLLGMAAIIPAYFIQTWLQPRLDNAFPGHTVSYNAILAFFLVATSEEISKYIMLRYYAYPHKAFDEPFDGIIYSVMIGMGFATLENIYYVLNYGFTTGLVRMFLSVPAHGAFGVLMGYHIGLAKFDPPRSHMHMLKGLGLAIFFHGAFDFFLFLQNSPQVKQYVSNGLLLAGALVSYWIAIRMSLRSIRLHQAISKQTFGSTGL
jgi:RsiW-degrading membrane proteinase PrsW (M82 family)